MSAVEKEHPYIAPVERAGKNAAEIGSRAEVVEDFYWRLDEGAAPLRLRIRPYYMTQQRLEELDRLVEQALEYDAERKSLKERRGPLKAQVFYEGLDGEPEPGEKESDAARKLRMIDERIAELEAQPNSLRIRALHFFIPVIKEWPFTINGEPVPLTEDGIAQVDPLFLTALQKALNDHFFSEKRQKRKG